MILLTFSFCASVRMSARMGMTPNLLSFSATPGLNDSTHRQKESWYCTWKLTLPDRTETRVETPSKWAKASL